MATTTLQAGGSNFDGPEQSSGPDPASPTELLQILMKEHKAVHELFLKMEQLGRSGAPQGQGIEALMAKLKFDLSTHNELEEKLFYPLLATVYTQRGLMKEAFQQHHEGDALLTELDQVVAQGGNFLPKLEQLMKGVLHHVDLEENQIHPLARQELTQERREELGRQFLQEKQRKSSGSSNTLRP